ncbi:metallophosphoesterase [Foliimonas ilicis]
MNIDQDGGNPLRGVFSRRFVLKASLGVGLLGFVPKSFAQQDTERAPIDATFLFTNDIHACRMGEGLSPKCEEEGKTDANLLRHITALNGLPDQQWPAMIDGKPSNLVNAGKSIQRPLGLVIGGDMTDDGGGQVAQPGEGTQLMQFSRRYQQGTGPDHIHFPVYEGLGNHDLDQDGPPPHQDWYRREMRDYVEINHRPSVFFKPPIPATNYDVDSDNYSWDWGGLHLIQLQRFGGDTRKDAISGLDWLKQDLKDYAGDGRPVILFQHYGWDDFSIERWNTTTHTFDHQGDGAPHWWSPEEQQALLAALQGYNIIGICHGHEHPTPMVYQHEGFDVFKPKAAFMGGFAMIHIGSDTMDVVLGEAGDDKGSVTFTNAFTKKIARG